MHEMVYARDVVDIANDYAQRAGAERVSAVYLTLGMSRDIVEEYFQGLFTWLARGTAAEGAEIVVRRLPFTVKCNRCGLVFPLDLRKTQERSCPCCGAERDYKLQTGLEFRIDKIEVVMPRAAAAAGEKDAVDARGAQPLEAIA